MEVNKTDHVYLTLLGKNYPVIQCQKPVNIRASQVPSNSEDSNFNSAASVINEEAVCHEIVDTDNLQHTDTAKYFFPPSLKSLASAVLHQVSSSDHHIDKETNDNSSQTDVDEESSVSGSFDLDHSNLTATDCINEAVNLALSLNETHKQKFEYHIDESSGNAQNSEISINLSNYSLADNGSEQLSPEHRNQISESNHIDTCNKNCNIPNVPEDAFISGNNLLSSAADEDDADISSVDQNVASEAENSFSIESDRSVISEELLIPSNSEDQEHNDIVSVTTKLNIVDYAQSEWKGSTYTASCLRNGYQMLMKNTGCNFLRQIRGDNYCALRATAFQILTQNVAILSSVSASWKDYLRCLPDTLVNTYGCTWLDLWTFADRLPHNKNNKLALMKECMNFFLEQKELSEAMPDVDDRQTHFLALFNSKSYAEIKLFEALKLLMLKKAVELHQCQSRGEDVPTFVWLLFARDTSEDPKSFMLNHLNLAGKSGGLEQVGLNRRRACYFCL